MPTNKDLSQYRLEQAEQCLTAAKNNLSLDDYKTAANRSYYCIFHCMRSLFALERLDFKKHSAVITHFREKYIKTGIFDKRLSDIITTLFRIRGESDYDDFYVVSKDEVRTQIENAEYFLTQVKAYLESQN